MLYFKREKRNYSGSGFTVQPVKKKLQTKAKKISNAEMQQKNSNKEAEDLFIYHFSFFPLLKFKDSY